MTVDLGLGPPQPPNPSGVDLGLGTPPPPPPAKKPVRPKGYYPTAAEIRVNNYGQADVDAMKGARPNPLRAAIPYFDVPLAYQQAIAPKNVGQAALTAALGPLAMTVANRNAPEVQQIAKDLRTGGPQAVSENDVMWRKGWALRIINDPKATPELKQAAKVVMEHPYVAGALDFIQEFANPSNYALAGAAGAIGRVSPLLAHVGEGVMAPVNKPLEYAAGKAAAAAHKVIQQVKYSRPVMATRALGDRYTAAGLPQRGTERYSELGLRGHHAEQHAAATVDNRVNAAFSDLTPQQANEIGRLLTYNPKTGKLDAVRNPAVPEPRQTVAQKVRGIQPQTLEQRAADMRAMFAEYDQGMVQRKLAKFGNEEAEATGTTPRVLRRTGEFFPFGDYGKPRFISEDKVAAKPVPGAPVELGAPPSFAPPASGGGKFASNVRASRHSLGKTLAQPDTFADLHPGFDIAYQIKHHYRDIARKIANEDFNLSLEREPSIDPVTGQQRTVNMPGIGTKPLFARVPVHRYVKGPDGEIMSFGTGAKSAAPMQKFIKRKAVFGAKEAARQSKVMQKYAAARGVAPEQLGTAKVRAYGIKASQERLRALQQAQGTAQKATKGPLSSIANVAQAAQQDIARATAGLSDTLAENQAAAVRARLEAAARKSSVPYYEDDIKLIQKLVTGEDAGIKGKILEQAKMSRDAQNELYDQVNEFIKTRKVKPDWVRRNGRWEMAGEWDNVPKKYLDTTKPSEEAFKGGAGKARIDGDADDIATEMGFEDGDVMREWMANHRRASRTSEHYAEAEKFVRQQMQAGRDEELNAAIAASGAARGYPVFRYQSTPGEAEYSHGRTATFYAIGEPETIVRNRYHKLASSSSEVGGEHLVTGRFEPKKPLDLGDKTGSVGKEVIRNFYGDEKLQEIVPSINRIARGESLAPGDEPVDKFAYSLGISKDDWERAITSEPGSNAAAMLDRLGVQIARNQGHDAIIMRGKALGGTDQLVKLHPGKISKTVTPEGAIKHLQSIVRKMVKETKTFEQEASARTAAERFIGPRARGAVATGERSVVRMANVTEKAQAAADELQRAMSAPVRTAKEAADRRKNVTAVAKKFQEVYRAYYARTYAATKQRIEDEVNKHLVPEFEPKVGPGEKGGAYVLESTEKLGSPSGKDMAVDPAIDNFRKTYQNLPESEAQDVKKTWAWFENANRLSRASVVAIPVRHDTNLTIAALAKGVPVKDLLPIQAGIYEEQLARTEEGRALIAAAERDGASSAQSAQRLFHWGDDYQSTVDIPTRARQAGERFAKVPAKPAEPGETRTVEGPLGATGHHKTTVTIGGKPAEPAKLGALGRLVQGGKTAQLYAQRGYNAASDWLFGKVQRGYELSIYKHLTEGGMSGPEAAMEVRKAMLRADNLSPFERKWMLDRAFYFYHWMRTAIPFWTKLGIVDPKWWVAPVAATRTLNEYQGYDDPSKPFTATLGETAPGSGVFRRATEPIPQTLLGMEAQAGRIPADIGGAVHGHFKDLGEDMTAPLGYFTGHLNPFLSVINDALALGAVRGDWTRTAPFNLFHADSHKTDAENRQAFGEAILGRVFGPFEHLKDAAKDPGWAVASWLAGAFLYEVQGSRAKASEKARENKLNGVVRDEVSLLKKRLAADPGDQKAQARLDEIENNKIQNLERAQQLIKAVTPQSTQGPDLGLPASGSGQVDLGLPP